MEETPKRPPADPPTQFGSAAAVSNSADNLRSDETLVPLSRSAETVIVPPSRSDETIITGAGNTRADRAGWGDKDPELQP